MEMILTKLERLMTLRIVAAIGGLIAMVSFMTSDIMNDTIKMICAGLWGFSYFSLIRSNGTLRMHIEISTQLMELQHEAICATRKIIEDQIKDDNSSTPA